MEIIYKDYSKRLARSLRRKFINYGYALKADNKKYCWFVDDIGIDVYMILHLKNELRFYFAKGENLLLIYSIPNHWDVKTQILQFIGWYKRRKKEIVLADDDSTRTDFL
jgi:hypothetical protein